MSPIIGQFHLKRKGGGVIFYTKTPHFELISNLLHPHFEYKLNNLIKLFFTIEFLFYSGLFHSLFFKWNSPLTINGLHWLPKPIWYVSQHKWTNTWYILWYISSYTLLIRETKKRWVEQNKVTYYLKRHWNMYNIQLIMFHFIKITKKCICAV